MVSATIISMRPFKDRHEAGKLLANYLIGYKRNREAIVLALPRGGVPIGYEIAHALELPLDIFLVRKLSVPEHSELAMGAIALSDIVVLNHDVIQALNISHEIIEAIASDESKELIRRNNVYRKGKLPLDLTNKIVILADDGIATGATMFAAVKAIKAQCPKRLIIAAPIASQYVCDDLLNQVDEIVTYYRSNHLISIGAWYLKFGQLKDEEVIKLLEKADFPTTS